MREKNIKLVVQYLTAIAFSLVWGMGIGSEYFAGGGSMGQILLRFLIVTYAASAIGVVVGDISLYKGHKLSILGIAAGLVLMAVMFYPGYFVFIFGAFLGEAFSFCLHWVVVTSSFVFGYNTVTFLQRKKQAKPAVAEEASGKIRWAETSFICSVCAWEAPLVIAGVVLVIVAVLYFGGSTISTGLSSLGSKGITKDLLVRLSAATSTALSIAALISGGVALWRIRGKERNVKAAGFVHNGLILCCLYLAVASGVCLKEIRTHRLAQAFKEQHPKFAESFNRLEVSMLYIGLMNYGNKYGKYPPAERWYDDVIILQNEHSSGEERFYKSPIKYAINPNAKPDSLPDTVLLFEAERGWNKFGGPELMAFDEQGRCLVVFNNGKTKFVEKKDVNELRWQ